MVPCEVSFDGSVGTDSRLLLVEDDHNLSRALSRVALRHGQVVLAATAQRARSLAADGGNWTAFIVDIGLPDESGLAVLADVRVGHPNTPALVLTGHMDHDVVNKTWELGAQYLLKPVDVALIDRFLSAASAAPFQVRVERAVQAWVVRYGVSEAEADVLRRAVLGDDRRTVAAARGSSEQTINKHVANLLRRTGDACLHVAVERLLRGLANGVRAT